MREREQSSKYGKYTTQKMVHFSNKELYLHFFLGFFLIRGINKYYGDFISFLVNSANRVLIISFVKCTKIRKLFSNPFCLLILMNIDEENISSDRL